MFHKTLNQIWPWQNLSSKWLGRRVIIFLCHCYAAAKLEGLNVKRKMNTFAFKEQALHQGG